MADAQQLDLVSASYGRPVAWAYGRHVLGGNVIVADDSDAQFPVRFFGLGHGPWNGVWQSGGIPQIWLNGVLLTAGEYHFHPGTDGEYSGGGGLVPESIGGDQKVDLWYPLGIQAVNFSRLAYLAVRFDASLIDPSSWDFRAIMETRKIQWYDAAGDPDGAPAYSENPARAFADLLLAVRGLPVSRLNWPAMHEAEDDCDVDIGSGVKRFVANVAWPNQASLDRALADVCETCRGFIAEDSDGKIFLKVAKARASSKSFTKANIIDASPPVTIAQEDVSSAANRLELSFADPNNGMQVVAKSWDHLPHQAAIGDIIPAAVNLPAMPQSQAERLGNYKLTRAITLNETIELRAGPDAAELVPGDVVDVVVDEDIWAGAETYEIEEATDEPTLQREIAARLYRDASYSDAAGAAQNLLATTIAKHWGPPATGDTAIPDAPDTFAVEAPRRWGMLRLSALGWTAAPTNVNSLRSAVFDVWSYDEIAGHSTNLFGGIDNSTPTLILIDNGYAVVGDHLYIDQEEMEIQTKSLDGQTITVARGVNASTPAAHLDAAPVWFLTRSSYWITLAPAMTAAELLDWFVEIYMPYLRVASAGVSLINSWGTSPPAWVTGLNTLDPGSGSAYGVRTGGGAMIGIEKPGLLEAGDPGVESDYMEQAGSIRDVFAALAGASSSGSVTIEVLHKRMVAGTETTVETITLTFLESEIASDVISGVSLQPEAAGDWYTLNITAPGTGAYGLEVFIRR